MNAEPKNNIGLIFVHGIGEQKRFEHLRDSVGALAELMAKTGPGIACSIADRTNDWKRPPGDPDPSGLAPITLTVTGPNEVLRYHCHEVYWADLGSRSGVLDVIGFWIWALGQWGAPIYRELDAAQLDKAATDAQGNTLNRQVSQLARLPVSVAGYRCREFLARTQLGLAGLAALFTLISWSLLKRIAAGLMQQAPDPTILVRYVGDVRTYEERAKPGDNALSDPGFPRRVGIRRRMVAEMVAMGVRDDLDRWYVLAHSQGSVLAYNGLTEIGHTLPNYLTEAQWNKVPNALRRDPFCVLRPRAEISQMMPARPAWLKYADVIDRKALFERLEGLVTYGSPLNKFAALWPRIVATATDRKAPEGEDPKTQLSAFSTKCRWVNLRAPQDPVAGNLNSFGGSKAKKTPPFEGFIPKLQNYTTPWLPRYLIAHLDYLKSGEAYSGAARYQQRRELADWLIKGGDANISDYPMGWFLAFVAIDLAYVAIVAVLGVFAAAVIATAGGLGIQLLTAKGVEHLSSANDAICAIRASVTPVCDVALGIILAAGYWRWIDDAIYSWRVARRKPIAAKATKGMKFAPTSRNVTEGTSAASLNLSQAIAGSICLAWTAWVLLGWIPALRLPFVIHRPCMPSWVPFAGVANADIADLSQALCLGVALALSGAMASFVQSIINGFVPPVALKRQTRMAALVARFAAAVKRVYAARQ